MKFSPAKLLVPKKASSRGDAIGVGMDIAVLVLLFVGVGWLIDNWLGTRPLFIIVCFVLAVVGQGTKMYVDYSARMDALQAERARRSSSPAAPAPAAAATNNDRAIDGSVAR